MPQESSDPFKILQDENQQLKEERAAMGSLICLLIKERGGEFTYDRVKAFSEGKWEFTTKTNTDGTTTINVK